MANRTEVVSLRFTPQQMRWLEEAAADDGLTVSALVRRAVGAYLLGEWESGYKPRKNEDEAADGGGEE